MILPWILASLSCATAASTAQNKSMDAPTNRMRWSPLQKYRAVEPGFRKQGPAETTPVRDEVGKKLLTQWAQRNIRRGRREKPAQSCEPQSSQRSRQVREENHLAYFARFADFAVKSSPATRTK